MKCKLAPSVLAADFTRLGEEVRAVTRAGVELVHVDVMDGHFVPNLSMGPHVVRALRAVTDTPLDVHLMVTDPGDFLDLFADAGASHITFHVEANGDPGELLERLEARGVRRGLALSPGTPGERVFPWLSQLDMVLVMTVHPGFGGQVFLGENLQKIPHIRAEEARLAAAGRRKNPLDVEVDGGLDARTIVACRDAGANVFVAGSSVFGGEQPELSVQRLRRALHPRSRKETSTT